MSLAPIMRHSDWRFLLRDLKNRADFRSISSLTVGVAQTALAMPATVARWIELFKPALKDKPNLHIVIAGAEWGPDCVDDGRWYQLIPLFLGTEILKVKVTLLGPNCKQTTRIGAPTGQRLKPLSTGSLGWPLIRDRAPVEVCEDTIGTYARDKGLFSVDLVVLSHPGFETHAADWLKQDELAVILTAGVPVAALAYDIAEYLHEIWILETFGYVVSNRAEHNPFSLVEEEALLPSAFGDTLWEILSPPPSPNFVPDPNRIAALKEFSLSSMELHAAGYFPRGMQQGTLITLPGLGELVYLLDEYFVAVNKKMLYRRVGGSRYEAIPHIELLPALIKAYPAQTTSLFERAMWAMKVAKSLQEP